MAGELVTEVFDYGGGRQVRVHVPPGRPEAVAFAGDGQLTFQWRGHLETAAAPPTLIVAVDRSAR